MPPRDPGGPGGVLRVTPAELRAAAAAVEGLGDDAATQAAALDGLLSDAAGGAGAPRLADSLGRAAWDFAGFARGLAADLGGEAGDLRAAADGYDHADAAGAATMAPPGWGGVPGGQPSGDGFPTGPGGPR